MLSEPPESLSGSVQVDGEIVDVTILPMTTELLTFISLEYHGRTFRFSVRGSAEPYEVAYQHEFSEQRADAEEEAAAWFPIAPVPADDGEVAIQQYLRPQLVNLHRSVR